MEQNKNMAQVQNRTAEQAVTPALTISGKLSYVAILVLAALAWVRVILQSTQMASGNSDMVEWFTLAGAASFTVAWAVMMAAMMLPSAAPMLVMYGAIRRNFSSNGQQGISIATFTFIYLAVWAALGLPVYAAGQAVGLLAESNPTLQGWLPYGLALILAAAGAYQFSPLKTACLRTCRSPMAFLLGNWRSGRRGTALLALKHALYCTGCCWALMAVLVAAGAMALQWVLAIAALVFAEKLLPYGRWPVRLIGIALLVLGLLVALQPGLANVLRGQMYNGAGM